MSKAEFIDRVAEKAELTRAAAARAVEAIFDTASGAISEAVHAAGTFSIPGFGKFTKKTRAARTGRNPRTGAVIAIPERSSVSFTAGKGLKTGASTSRRKKTTTGTASKRAAASKSAGGRATASKRTAGAAKTTTKSAGGARKSTAKSAGVGTGRAAAAKKGGAPARKTGGTAARKTSGATAKKGGAAKKAGGRGR